jgi:dTDP-4-dehydrorhamnose reductase
VPDARRVLILGATGMLGHKLWLTFREWFETWATVRTVPAVAASELFDDPRVLHGIDLERTEQLDWVLRKTSPGVVVNCAGIVKQRSTATDPVACITVNALLPQRLAAASRERGFRLIQISTDCVFSGERGNYTESDRPDADDLYGRSKVLGEVSGPAALTLRTSIIGRELHGQQGLIEWFLAQRDRQVRGYTHARFSGVPTCELARILAVVITEFPSLTGLFHVSSESIDKHLLLQLLNTAFDARVEIIPEPAVRLDRTLDGGAFRRATGLTSAPWPALVEALVADAEHYEHWREAR